MVLKTRGLGTGTTFMRGSYVVEPRLHVWLRERTALVKSEHELTSSEYTENIYILIFAFAAQSSLLKVRNDNERNAVRMRGMCAVPTRQHPCRIHKPVLGTRYSGTVPCRKKIAPIMISMYVQLHIDDRILCIINDVMIVLY